MFTATVEFLQLLDSGYVDQTWSITSPMLKASTSEIMWINGIKVIRLGLGGDVERTSATIGFTSGMPDVPRTGCGVMTITNGVW